MPVRVPGRSPEPGAGLTRRELLGLGAAALLPLRQDGPVDLRAGDLGELVVRPEYRRALDRVLLHFPSSPISREAVVSGDRRDVVSVPFIRNAFRDIIDALPDYTEIRMAARRDQRDAALQVLARAGERPAQLHLVEDRDVEVDMWTQDLGEAVRVDGASKFLVARRMHDDMGPQAKMSRDRFRVAQFLFGREAVIEAPFVFEGGNLAFDVGSGGLRVLVGHNAVRRTRDALALVGRRLERAAVLDLVAATFGASEAIELGHERQSRWLQHIDQSFAILGPGLAAVVRLVDDERPAEKRQLEDHAAQLRELGYDLLYVDHTGSDIESWYNSVNVVPFLERTTGRKRILFPVFPGEIEGGARGVSRSDLTGKAARAFDIYHEAGYEPTPIRDLTHVLGGNTHCIVNALA